MSINPILAALEESQGQNQQPKIAEVISPSASDLNLTNLSAEFSKFKKSLAGKDPVGMLQHLVSSGQMSRELLLELKNKALGLMSILK